LRRGIIASNPTELLSDDERPRGGGVGTHHEWEPGEIAELFSAAEELATRSESRYDYAPLVKLLTLTGLRVGEALALRWADVDLLKGLAHVRLNLNRDGSLGAPKTSAGERDVWLSPGLVDMLVRLKPEDATDEEFVFASRNNRRRPISYHNFRQRGFRPALKKAGLAGKGITIHTLRSAAISLYAASGLTLEETAKVMGQKNPHVTWRHYYRLFDKTTVAERVRAAQTSITDLT
jgi:integrase